MTNGLVTFAANKQRQPEHYRIDVVARSVADVVRCAGGWIYDHVVQGWAVNVVVPEPTDIRPIEILGATLNELIAPESPVPQIFLDDAAGTEVVEHRLSSAARLFKAQALIAAQIAPTTDPFERLVASIPAVEVIELQAVTAALRS